MDHKLGKVGVIFGGRSAERSVSLKSGQGVLEALRSKGVDAHPFDPASQNLADLASQKFDRVFIALHGRYGEDGSLQGALELLGIPYTGSNVLASSLTINKFFTKRIWQSYDLPTPKFAVCQTFEDLEKAAATLGFPLAVKPALEGSSIGFSKVTSINELASAWEKASQCNSDILAEEFIAGRELTVAILGSGKNARALPVIEIVAPNGNYDFEHKYISNDTQYLCPAPLEKTLTEKIQELALKAYLTAGCSGWGRVDVMLRNDDQHPFLLEVNTSPGMTDHSLVPMAAKATGLDYASLCVEIAASAALHIGSNKD